MDNNDTTNQDGIITPRSLPALRVEDGFGPAHEPGEGASPAPRAPRHPTRLLWVALALCFLVSLLSLASSAFLIYRLTSLRETAITGLDSAIANLDSLGDQGIRFDYQFSGTVPFSGDVPIRQDLVFPFRGTVPINTTVQVPINAGALGTFTIDVPVNTTFDVDIEVPVSVDQTIHVDTEVPLDMVIPIDLRADDPLLATLIEQVRAWLITLRGSL